MSSRYDVVVVGGGIGGLCAAIQLAARGRNVLLVESASTLGGKAGSVVLDGVEVDTGPSVLTLPDVFDEVFESAGMVRSEVLSLREPNPSFRYIYPDGVSLDVFPRLEETCDSVRQTLGSAAGREFVDYMLYAAKIWESAAPHFVMAHAPDVKNLLLAGPRAWGAVAKIDPFHTMKSAIAKKVKSPHLAKLLMRYATYNGSDVRRAPATLNCIAHVELKLGGYGVDGGMGALVAALAMAAEKVGVEVELGQRVTRVSTNGSSVSGVCLADGRSIAASQVVMNGDAAHLFQDLLESKAHRMDPQEPSMSAYNAVYRAKLGGAPRVAHTVLFPKDYDAEFSALFDQCRVPDEPTIYLCAQSQCHGREAWADAEPVFAMLNAPAVSRQERIVDVWPDATSRLINAGLVSSADEILWQRSPLQLAQRFPGSDGYIYGAASNSSTAAFHRPANRVSKVRGLYLASGSAHPGGGVPMVAQSGKLAAKAALADS